MPAITSRQNPVVRRFRDAAGSASDHLLLDGPHLIEEALAAGLALEAVALDANARADIAAIGGRAEAAGAEMLSVTAEVLAAMTPVRQPSGIVAIAARRPQTLDDALEGAPQLVLMLDEVQDPGNVGAIVRAADACGATGIVAGHGTADPLGWKALRGSMGSVFRVPIASKQPLAAAARLARQRGLDIVAAVPRGGTSLPDCDLRRPVAVLLGGEGAGLPPSLIALAGSRLTIPMRPPVESLNVATAAAVIVYEAQRQRTGVPA